MSMVAGHKARSCAASVLTDKVHGSMTDALRRVARTRLYPGNGHRSARGVFHGKREEDHELVGSDLYGRDLKEVLCAGHGAGVPRSTVLEFADYPPLISDSPDFTALETAGRPFVGRPCDLVLSSGFLAFALHTGFLQAVEDAKIEVSGIMGTSAGALSGSLFAAGMSAQQVAKELSESPPVDYLRLLLPPVRNGSVSMISLDPVVAKLRTLLPATFEELERDFAVGVVDSNGNYALINSGPLPEAVAASAAIPLLFAPIHIPGQPHGPFKDGGVVCRTGLTMWRDMRRQQMAAGGLNLSSPPPVLVHLVERSSRFSGNDDVNASGEKDVTVVRSPRSGVNFFSLGNYIGQFESARRRATQEIWVQ